MGGRHSDIREAAFATAYVRFMGNGTKAARAAGYTGKPETLWSQASVLLRSPKVQAVLAELRHERIMGALEVLDRHTDIGRGTMEDFLDKENRLDLKRAKARSKLHLIRELTQTETTYHGKDGSPDTTEVVTKVKLYDAQLAQKTLMQFHGLLEVIMRKRPKDPREVQELLFAQMVRVHGEPKARELAAGIGLKFIPALKQGTNGHGSVH